MVPLPDDISPSGISYADRLRMATRWSGAVRLSDVPFTDIGWLWPGRIPLGNVTLLVSDPSAGKSLLALDIAARVSRGSPWPDHASNLNPEPKTLNPSSVLLSSPSKTISPTQSVRVSKRSRRLFPYPGFIDVPGDDLCGTPRRLHSTAI